MLGDRVLLDSLLHDILGPLLTVYLFEGESEALAVAQGRGLHGPTKRGTDLGKGGKVGSKGHCGGDVLLSRGAYPLGMSNLCQD